MGTGVVIVGGMDYEGAEATPRCRKVVDGAAELAREMGHSYVGVEHLFLAIIRDRGAVPTQALGKLADLDRVEAGLLEVMASASYRGQAPPAELLGGGAGAGNHRSFGRKRVLGGVGRELH
jgi:Clp amino terminal domain, pathogenicity island component